MVCCTSKQQLLGKQPQDFKQKLISFLALFFATGELGN